MGTKLRPALTLSDIYGPDRFLFPRAVEGYCDWLPQAPQVLDSLTGGQFAIAGDMPIVCSEGFNTSAGVDLLESAGLEMGARRIHFGAGGALDALSRAAHAPDSRVVLQHALPPNVSAHARPWIERRLLQYLNNKASLTELVAPEHLPPRRVVNRDEYFSRNDRGLPVVLKVVSEQSNGGGCGVMICRSSADLCQAERLFSRCEQIVVEEMLEIRRNPCLNFAVMVDGEVRYLGFADQDIGPDGKYRGNWMEAASPIAQGAIDVAMEPVRRAAELGYCGVAGVDLAFTPDGAIYVLDLNFRLNGCTPMILLADALKDGGGAEVIHFRKLQGRLGGDALADALTPFVRDGRLVPLSLFDAVAAGYPGKPASVQALTLGSSREEVLALEAEIVAVIA